jgi:hypothetical protein
LEAEHPDLRRWREAGAVTGWQLQEQTWPETLGLEVSSALIARWLEPGSAYRRRLGSLDARSIGRLEELLQRQRGSRLPQDLEHTLVVAQRPD